VLERTGYHSISASLRQAEVLLASQTFDLVVLSGVGEHELRRILSVANGGPTFVLDDFTQPAELLITVADKPRPHPRQIA
jgi:hypothetical protein